MALSLLNGGEDATVARWNTLFQALDDKLHAVMNGKSFLLTRNSEVFRFMGLPFFFVNGARVQSGWLGGKNYNHDLFREVAASAEVEVFDSSAKIARLKNPVPFDKFVEGGINGSDFFFDRSLEAHRRLFQEPDKDPSQYWLMELNALYPQRFWRYGFAEVIFEGAGLEEFDFQPAWDKFGCFRIHNLNRYEMTVAFPGRFTLTIPPLDVRCVRRDSATSGYTEGFRYFQKFKPGDPRTFGGIHPGRLPVNIAEAMGANNLFSPFISYRVIAAFLGSRGLGGGGEVDGAKFDLDPHELYDVRSLYADYFGNPNDDATIIGDLLHHKGKLIAARIDDAGQLSESEVEFRGYSDLKNRWPSAYKISVTEDENGFLKLETSDSEFVAHDLWAQSTNLLNDGVKVRPGMSLNFPFTLASHSPAQSVTPAVEQVVQETATYYATNDSPFPTEVIIEMETGYAGLLESTLSGQSLRIHKHTVGQVKSLSFWGSPDVVNQNSNVAVFTNRALMLTPFGLTLKFDQEFDLNFLNPAHSDVLQSIYSGGIIDLTRGSYSLTESRLISHGSITFTDYGWPTRFAGAAFTSPRAERIYAKYRVEDGQRFHPDIRNEPFGDDGADFDCTTIEDVEENGVRILETLEQSYVHAASVFPFFRAETDGHYDLISRKVQYSSNRTALLGGTSGAGFPSRDRFIRLNLLREHYNALASTINAIKGCRPFSFFSFRVEANGEAVNFVPGSLGILPGGSIANVGPYSGRFRPANEFCQVQKDSALWRVCSSLGVRIRTKDDLPESLIRLKEQQTLSGSFLRTYQTFYTFVGKEPASRPDFDVYHYKATVKKVSERSLIGDGGLFSGQYLRDVFGGSTTDDEYHWLAVEDVKSLAESLGFQFALERAVIPYRLTWFDISFGGLLVDDDETEREYDWSIETVRGSSTEDFADSPIEGVPLAWEGRRTIMVPAIEPDEIEWIADIQKPAKVVDYRAGNKLYVGAGNVFYIGSLNASSPDEIEPYRFYRELPSLINKADNVRYTLTPSILHQSFLSDGLEGNTSVLQVPQPWFRHTTEDFTGEAKKDLGASFIPLEIAGTVVVEQG